MKKKIVLLCLGLIGCQETTVRKPIYQSKDDFLNSSVTRNKKLNNQQQFLFQQIALRDSFEFKPSPEGYWFTISESNNNNTIKPSTGDQVIFEYSIQSIENRHIYEKNELGEISYIVDKEEILPILRYAVKELSVGESGIFLVPSYLAHGYLGDGEKIGINEPLRLIINLKELKKINPSSVSK